MSEIITGTVAKRADQIAMQEMGFKSLDLMETASSKVAMYINRHYTYEREARILVLAGVGNNGADAVAVARMLKETDYITGNAAESLLADCEELIRLIVAIVKTSKDGKQ